MEKVRQRSSGPTTFERFTSLTGTNNTSTNNTGISSAKKMELLEQRITAPPRQPRSIHRHNGGDAGSAQGPSSGRVAQMSTNSQSLPEVGNQGGTHTNSHSSQSTPPQSQDSQSRIVSHPPPLIGSSTTGTTGTGTGTVMAAPSPSSFSLHKSHMSTSASMSMSSNQTLITAHVRNPNTNHSASQNNNNMEVPPTQSQSQSHQSGIHSTSSSSNDVIVVETPPLHTTHRANHLTTGSNPHGNSDGRGVGVRQGTPLQERPNPVRTILGHPSSSSSGGNVWNGRGDLTQREETHPSSSSRPKNNSTTTATNNSNGNHHPPRPPTPNQSEALQHNQRKRKQTQPVKRKSPSLKEMNISPKLKTKRLFDPTPTTNTATTPNIGTFNSNMRQEEKEVASPDRMMSANTISPMEEPSKSQVPQSMDGKGSSSSKSNGPTTPQTATSNSFLGGVSGMDGHSHSQLLNSSSRGIPTNTNTTTGNGNSSYSNASTSNQGRSLRKTSTINPITNYFKNTTSGAGSTGANAQRQSTLSKARSTVVDAGNGNANTTTSSNVGKGNANSMTASTTTSSHPNTTNMTPSNVIHPSPKHPSTKTKTTNSTSIVTNYQNQINELKQNITTLQSALSDKTAQLKAVANNQTLIHHQLKSTLLQKEKDYSLLQDELKKRNQITSEKMEELIRKESGREMRELRQKLASDGARLGRWVYNRMGIHAVEPVWEDGFVVKGCRKKRADLKRRREVWEKRREEGWREKSRRREGVDSVSCEDDSMEQEEFHESIRVHLEELDREERELNKEEESVLMEKIAHKRAMKRVANEDSSRFKSRPKLHDRYIPLSLLGRGGFSEVWRAYDLNEYREVAVKIHQIDPRWAEAKIENYTKHVAREYSIHRGVQHERIVSLYDVFEIDTNSFATVLECCNGTDLDTLLQERNRLSERHSRAILLQILSGMKYLSTPSEDKSHKGIIHYDLKPGNILFDEFGDAKITDFGLSKIMDSPDPTESMELTSQGAGTYWYLPPECFITSSSVRITNKVDVWSIGVIFYQMLFGKRPFGDGQSQEKVLSNNVMLNAREVQFPSSPVVSEECKDFIRQCLTYEQTLRPSISELCKLSYVNKSRG